MFGKKSVLAIAFLFLVVPAAADWSINDIESPKSLDDVSNDTQSVQLVEILDNDGDPVNKSRLDDSTWTLDYNYSSDIDDMEHLGAGYWYANFTANESKTNIEYELTDTSPDGGEINTSETLSFDDYSVDILNDFEKLEPGEQIFIEVNVTDEVSDESENDNATVDFVITNGTHVDTTELGYNNGLFTNFVTVPDYYNSEVALHAHAYNSSRGGSESTLTTVYPESTGNVKYLNTSSGCNNDSMFSGCERTAQIETGFNVTPLSANSVTLELMKSHEDGGYDSVENISMEKNDGIWEAEYEMPDINTSKYEKKLVTNYNASIDNNDFEVTRNISYEGFTIRDKSDPSAFPGTNYMIQILFGKYYSLEPLNDTRIDQFNASVDYPNGSDFMEFDDSDFEYNDDNNLYENEISIPEDAEEGSYDMNIQGWNLYNEKKTRDSAFSVESADSSFNTSSATLDFNYSDIGFKTEELEITNRLNQELEISAEFDDELENISEFGTDNSLVLEDSETVNASLIFDMEEVEDYTGQMTLTGDVNDYSKDFEIVIDNPDCTTVNGTLCYDSDQMWINQTADEVRSYTTNVTIQNLGEASSFVSAEVSGDVSEYLEINPSDENIVDEQSFMFNFTPKREGEFTGTVSFSDASDELNLHTKFVSNVENLQTGIDADSSINIASAVTGGTVERDIRITNTGDVNITGLSVSSDTFDIEIASLENNIAPGDSATAQVTINSIQESSGEFTVTGQTADQGDASATVSVSGSLVDYEEDIESARSTINDLKTQTTDEDITSRLTSLERELTSIENLYDSGETSEANSRLNSLESDLSSIESDINSGGSPGTDPGTGEETDPGTGEETDPGTGETGDSGGLPLVPIAVVIFVLLIIGFVFYSSYIPEEGDPLYEYLGEE